METNTKPTSDECTLAMLSHLSIVLGGIILPIILWAVQKDKSQFVRFHSLQSIFYHISYIALIFIYVIFMVLILIVTGIGFAGLGNSHSHSHNDPSVIWIILMIALYLGMFVIIFAGIGYSVFLAIKSYKGNYTKIPIIGNIIYKKIFGT